MGSTFVTLDPSKSDTEAIFGAQEAQTIWLQFVPGIVGYVVTGTDTPAFNVKAGDPPRRFINSILAKPHIGDNLKGTANLDDPEDRYYPLFRGIVDVPMIGDPVLLCTIGGVQYYMGPLNTAGVPGYNPDHLETSDSLGFFQETSGSLNTTTRDIMGLSKNWIGRNTFRREKHFNLSLDDPDNQRTHLNNKRSDPTITGDNMTLGDIHGDLIFEGRHGNSIRIGSRNINPYIILNNYQYKPTEGVEFGSTIAMLERGTIRQHFAADVNDKLEPIEFQLSSDNSDVNDTIRKIGDTYNYDFGLSDVPAIENQMLFTSDRITINARRDNIFLSSLKNITMGTGDSLVVKSKNDIIFDAANIYLGKAYDDNNKKIKMESLVMGNELVLVLGEMIDAIGKILVAGTVGGTSLPVMTSGSPGWATLHTTVRRRLSDILSTFHKIENNKAQK